MKRFFSIILSVAVMVIILSGCGESRSSLDSSTNSISSSAAVAETKGDTLSGELVVWCWDMALDQLKDAAKVFKERYPEVSFIFELISSEQIYDKLTPILATGTGLPDIVALEGEQFARFAQKFPDKFADFTGVVNQSEFLPNKIAEATINGKLLALPWDAAPVALFYRQDIFEQAGINTDDIKTYDDFIEAGKQVKTKTGMAMLPMATSRNDQIFRYLLMQQKVFYFDKDGKPNLNSPEAITAMEIVKKLYDAGITINHNDWSEYIGTFTQDKAACVIEAVWINGSMKVDGADQSGKWRVRSLPMINDNSKGVASNGGSLLAVASTKEKNKAAAKEFIKFALTDKECQVNGFANWGLYPSYIPAYSDSVFSESDAYYGGQKIYELFNDLAQQIPTVNYTENFGETVNTNKNAVAQVCLEGKDVKETMEGLQKELEAKLR